MKKLLILLLFVTSFCMAQPVAQSPTFKDELFGKTNIIHIGGRGYIEKDDFLHSTVGAWLGSSVYMYTYYKTDNKILSMATSLLVAFGAGELKEFHDRKNGGRFSNDDVAKTTLGGFSGAFTKVIQIGIQEQNKLLSKQYKEAFENLAITP